MLIYVYLYVSIVFIIHHTFGSLFLFSSVSVYFYMHITLRRIMHLSLLPTHLPQPPFNPSKNIYVVWETKNSFSLSLFFYHYYFFNPTIPLLHFILFKKKKKTYSFFSLFLLLLLLLLLL